MVLLVRDTGRIVCCLLLSVGRVAGRRAFRLQSALQKCAMPSAQLSCRRSRRGGFQKLAAPRRMDLNGHAMLLRPALPILLTPFSQCLTVRTVASQRRVTQQDATSSKVILTPYEMTCKTIPLLNIFVVLCIWSLVRHPKSS